MRDWKREMRKIQVSAVMSVAIGLSGCGNSDSTVADGLSGGNYDKCRLSNPIPFPKVSPRVAEYYQIYGEVVGEVIPGDEAKYIGRPPITLKLLPMFDSSDYGRDNRSKPTHFWILGYQIERTGIPYPYENRYCHMPMAPIEDKKLEFDCGYSQNGSFVAMVEGGMIVSASAKIEGHDYCVDLSGYFREVQQ